MDRKLLIESISGVLTVVTAGIASSFLFKSDELKFAIPLLTGIIWSAVMLYRQRQRSDE